MKRRCAPVRAAARVQGDAAHPGLHGMVTFTQTERGVLVDAKICGLPCGGEENTGIFAFHIHEGDSCAGNRQDSFANARGHYNPRRMPHPQHAGDLPPLFGNQGYASMSVLTDRFTVREILGRVVIIHANPDDFVTQPSGNAGNKIACGKIFAR